MKYPENKIGGEQKRKKRQTTYKSYNNKPDIRISSVNYVLARLKRV
jgi:hypothetical protein